MNIHFISIGGSAMHNLAIALHKKGYRVSGSDDEIFEPSKSRLASYGLLPDGLNWNVKKITPDLDAVILGMHAKKDNPELLKALERGIRIYSYPEYIYEQSKNKTRIVISGSHGKTSITAMLLHVLQYCKKNTDYLVGAKLNGFDTMAKLTEDAPLIIIEGDEYLSSPIDLRPKFHLYRANIALLSGISWDHVNVFPTLADYTLQFRIFLDTIEPGGFLAYCQSDNELSDLVDTYFKTHPHTSFEAMPYHLPPYRIENGQTQLLTEKGVVNLAVFGKHNLLNLAGSLLISERLGIPKAAFYEAVQTFKGAANRLELIDNNPYTAIYKDFAHSPSKLQATIMAMKEQYPNRHLVACMELHTFSSLNKTFLKQYAGTMDTADEAIIYFNPHTIQHKGLEAISEQEIKSAFDRSNIHIFAHSVDLKSHLLNKTWKNTNLLLMSSGNFDGMDMKQLATTLLA